MAESLGLENRVRAFFDVPEYQRSSEAAGALVAEIVAADPSTQDLSENIRYMAKVLPKDNALPSRLTALFNKLCHLPEDDPLFPSEIQELFYLNPDVLADALVKFVQEDPTGKQQENILREIFNPRSLKRDAVELYSEGSVYALMTQGLKNAAADIDTLRGAQGQRRGVSHIVRQVIASVEAERDATKQHLKLFP